MGRGLFQPQCGLDPVNVGWVGAPHLPVPLPKQPEMNSRPYPEQNCGKSSLVQPK